MNDIRRRALLPALLGLVAAAAAAASADVPLDAASDAEHMPPEDSSALFWQGREQLAGFRNIDSLAPVRWIRAGDEVLSLPRAEQDLGAVTFEHEGSTMTVDDYVSRQRAAGLLVIRDGRIIYERYALGNDAETRWI